MPDNPVEILLVEDNPNDVELALYSFRKHNLANRIQVARDGVEALEFLFGPDPEGEAGTGHTPKVILLDLKLPKIDGLEVLRRIRANARTHLIPVVVLTSSREQRDIIESYQLGINSYIVKPVDFEQFIEAMRHFGMYWLLLNHPPILDSGT
jgi:CheY-like chemotaxis protein